MHFRSARMKSIVHDPKDLHSATWKIFSMLDGIFASTFEVVDTANTYVEYCFRPERRIYYYQCIFLVLLKNFQIKFGCAPGFCRDPTNGENSINIIVWPKKDFAKIRLFYRHAFSSRPCGYFVDSNELCEWRAISHDSKQKLAARQTDCNSLTTTVQG